MGRRTVAVLLQRPLVMATSRSDVGHQVLAKDLVTIVLAVYTFAPASTKILSCPCGVRDMTTETNTMRLKCYAYCDSLDGATLFSKVDSNKTKLRLNGKNEMTLICAKLGADLTNISKVTNRKMKWPALYISWGVGLLR